MKENNERVGERESEREREMASEVLIHVKAQSRARETNTIQRPTKSTEQMTQRWR